jgi:Flp pilus assembly pilin Flp
MNWLRRNEDGQASIEYAVLASLLSIVAITVITQLGIQVQNLFQDVVNVFP